MERKEYLLEVELTDAFEKLRNLSSREKEKAINLIKNLIGENEVRNCSEIQGFEKTNGFIEPNENSGNFCSETDFTAEFSESKSYARKDFSVLSIEPFKTKQKKIQLVNEFLVSPNFESQNRNVDSTSAIVNENQSIKVKPDIRTYSKKKRLNKTNNDDGMRHLKGPVYITFKGEVDKKKGYCSTDKGMPRIQDVPTQIPVPDTNTCSSVDADYEFIEYEDGMSTAKRCNLHTHIYSGSDSSKCSPGSPDRTKRPPSRKFTIDTSTPTRERLICLVEGCGYSASYQSRMDVHMVKHTREKNFKCQRCFKEYSQKSTLTQHQKACSQPSQVQPSTNLISLQDELNKDAIIDNRGFHRRSENGSILSSAESDELFDRGRHNKKNKKMDSVNRNCDRYSNESQNQRLEELNRDEQRAGLGGEKLVEELIKRSSGHLLCETCGKMFRNGAHLKRHVIREHSGGFNCAKCSFFGTPSEVRIHEGKCQGKKVVECPVCSKTIVASFFQSHMTQHVNQTPFLCNLCGKSFKAHRYLQSHLRLRHQKRQFDCKVCGKEFETFGKLQRHEIVHTASKPFGCPLCSYKANVKNNVCKHARMIHKVTNFTSEQVLVARWSLTNRAKQVTPVELYDDGDAEFLLVANERSKTITKISPPIEDVLKKLEKKTGLSVTIEELMLNEKKKQAKGKLKTC